MVPPVMVTSLTVLTPPLLVTPIMWDGSTVKVTTAVSPALMVVLSSVMVAMGFPFNGMWIALVRCIQAGGRRSRRFPFDTMDAQELGRVSFAARGQGHGGRGCQRCSLPARWGCNGLHG